MRVDRKNAEHFSGAEGVNFKMTIGNIPIKHTYRPAQIICDVLTLAGLVIIAKNAFDTLADTKGFLGYVSLVSLLFPAAALGMIAAYLILTCKSLKFGKYKITKKNAQSVYNWWAFSLALIKLPLFMVVFELEYSFTVWAITGRTPISMMILLYALLAVILIRLTAHRLAALTEVKRAEADNSSAIRIKTKVADKNKDDEE